MSHNLIKSSLGFHVRRVRGRPGAISGMVAITGHGGPLQIPPCCALPSLTLIYDERPKKADAFFRGTRWFPASSLLLARFAR